MDELKSNFGSNTKTVWENLAVMKLWNKNTNHLIKTLRRETSVLDERTQGGLESEMSKALLLMKKMKNKNINNRSNDTKSRL
jgi:hypothetical protein